MTRRLILGAVALALLAGSAATAAGAAQNPFEMLQHRIQRTFEKLDKQLQANQPRTTKLKTKKDSSAVATDKDASVKPKAAVKKDVAAKKPPPDKPAGPATVAVAKDEAVPVPPTRPDAPAIGGYTEETAVGGYTEKTPVGGYTEAPAASEAGQPPPASGQGQPPLPRMNPRVASAVVDLPTVPPLPAPSPVKPPIRLASLPPADADVDLGMARLNALGVVGKALPEISESACGVPDPVAVASLDNGDVPFSGKATVNHKIAATLAAWVRNEVEPSAREILSGQLTGLRIVDSYGCRTRDHVKDAKLSEHAFGNAIDIAAFKIDKKWIEVGGDHPADQQKFLDKIRAAACGPFTTVLGPGSDSYHSSHFHLDLAARNRKGKSRGLFCQ